MLDKGWEGGVEACLIKGNEMQVVGLWVIDSTVLGYPCLLWEMDNNQVRASWGRELSMLLFHLCPFLGNTGDVHLTSI